MTTTLSILKLLAINNSRKRSLPIQTIFLIIYFVFQSTLIIRNFIVQTSFNYASVIYIRFKKAIPWRLTTADLLSYDNGSLGFAMGCFLLKNDLNPQPGCESHDVFHVLSGYDTSTVDEIAMQYWLYGNGKRSPFVALALIAGIVLYPEEYLFFIKAYRRGKASPAYYHLNFKELLKQPLDLLKNQLNIK